MLASSGTRPCSTFSRASRYQIVCLRADGGGDGSKCLGGGSLRPGSESGLRGRRAPLALGLPAIRSYAYARIEEVMEASGWVEDTWGRGARGG